MEKEFNVTGICIPGQHYMADTSAKFRSIMRLIEQGKYFTINRPRQYGKTTMLFRLTEALRQSEQYLVFRISFEGVGDTVFANEQSFCSMFLELLHIRMEQQQQKKLEQLLQEAIPTTHDLKKLTIVISNIVRTAGRKIVLLIDEVDKSSNNQLFISFLGILRDKYLERSEAPTFHSVVLTGVHDVKTLKLKLSPEAERKYNSPWNIAADFEVDMNLQVEEIVPMLTEYAADRKATVAVQAVAERLFYYTSGYPFLVSKLCKICDEKLLPQKNELVWTAEDVDEAALKLTGETNTNFDELSKNLDNNPELYELVKAVAIEGQRYSFSPLDPNINLGILYGIFADRNGLVIHNRIYQQIITNKMSFRILRENSYLLDRYDAPFNLPDNRLDMRKALLKFQELMKAEYSKKDRDFLEHQGRLVFLAFLKPILNGHGHAFKEPQMSEERRLDVLIAYHQHRYVIELKIWRGAAAHQSGLDQLTGYLDALSLDEGGLLIFDHSGVKAWKQEEIVHQGKRIFAVWV